MTPGLFILIAVSGGLGAVARFMLDGYLRTRVDDRLPWPTIMINLSGSLGLGVLAGLLIGGVVPQEWYFVVGAGFLGGYTTFSTTSYETVQLLRERKSFAAAANSLGLVIAAAVCACAGLWLGSALA